LGTAMAQFSNAVYTKSRLPLRIREAARIMIAYANECVVCQNTRDAEGEANGVDEEFYDYAAQWRTWPGYSDAERIAKTIHQVYTAAESVCSLVTAGWTGRPTEANPPSIVQPMPWPQPWYTEPCQAYEAATGRSWQDGLARIRTRLGADWTPASARELAHALTLVQ